MTRLRALATLIAAASLAACTDYATFVTATNIGINADVKTQDVSIGYGRAELFTGPGYPEQGEAPRAVGFINSDLHVIQPHIQQLYATGDAAELVTIPDWELPQPTPSSRQPEIPRYFGERRPLVFATGANIGLKLGFGAGTAPVPSSIKFGYNREEASVIPLQSTQPIKDRPDQYAPVLASMDMNLKDASSQTNTNLGITQFFATGSAARNLAVHPDIRRYFYAKAQTAVAAAAADDATQLEVKKALAFEKADYEAVAAYFASVPPSRFEAVREKILRDAGLSTHVLYGPRLRATKNKDEFLEYVKRDPAVANRIARTIANL